MSQERKRPFGRARAWLAAIAVSARLPWLRRRRPRARFRATSGASRRRRRRPPNSSSACARAASTASASRSNGAASSRISGAEANLDASDALVGGAAAAGLKVLPFVYGAPSWAVTSARVPGPGNARAPKTLPVKTGAQRTAWTNFLKRSSPLRARRQLLGRQPGAARQADPHLADLERAELQVLRRAAQPGRVRQAGQALLRGDQERRPRRQDRPRRACSRSPRRPHSRASRRRPTSPPTSSNSSTRRRRGSSASSTASPCTPTPTTTRS